jgi:hypothetical protein
MRIGRWAACREILAIPSPSITVTVSNSTTRRRDHDPATVAGGRPYLY